MFNILLDYDLSERSGRSAVWLARCPGRAKVAGSSSAAATKCDSFGFNALYEVEKRRNFGVQIAGVAPCEARGKY